ncbi:MAG: HlyD family efflux transporter periplasmic adaptor subunit [Oscillospiraceae bacterium]
MKSRKFAGAAVAVLLLAVLAYFGMELFRALSDPFTTTSVTQSVAEETVRLSGYIVRQETVLDNPSGLLSLALNEGEKVGVGQTVAILYSNDDAMELQQELQALQVKQKQLSYAESVTLGTASALRLDSEILEELLTLRCQLSAVGLGGETESTVAALRAMVMQRDYSAGDADPTEELRQVEKEIAALEARLKSSAKEITAPAAGIYSAAVDGYEAVLTPETAAELRPSELLALQPDAAVSSSLGKLIGSATWYFVSPVEAETAARLQKGRSVQMRFSGALTGDISCRVESVGAEEDGKCTVLFSCANYVSEMTRLRKAEAEIVFDSWSGLRVPKKALRVDENGQTGVYCVMGLAARFKPVSIIYTGEDYCLVEADEPKNETLRIRAGDTAIIAAKDLYDGKIVG